MSPLRRRALGDAALVVGLGDGIDASVNARVRALDCALGARPCPGVLETVPAYATLLVRFDPRVVAAEALWAALEERLAGAAEVPPSARLHEIPTQYGGDAGPDLEAVARHAGLRPEEVVARHAGAEYTAFMLGFRPGFPYLGLLPPELEMPRLATPRVRVAAGAVAIAGLQTGIYPEASPGGWNLIGRTGVRLFDPARERPALVEPGDRVRFVPMAELPEPAPVTPPPVSERPATVEVLEGGLLTSVQDGGRPGWLRLGVPEGGALDRAALAAANRALGNPATAAGLECTLVGPTLLFRATTRLALAGGDLGAVLERADLGAWPVPHGVAVLARPGNLLRFAGRRSGCRAYLALAGGLDVPLVLGSRSTDLGSGFGGFAGRALRAGDRLALGGAPPAAGRGAQSSWAAGPIPAGPVLRVTAAAEQPVRVRVVLGPQQEHLAPEAVRRFLDAVWEVSAASDRIGLRLAGPRLTHVGPAEIVSEGMLPGAIQVPPDGQPIVMLADGPTTGGYPKLACVVTADLDRLAQCVPGTSRVSFAAVGRG